jgi:hypothetical protein
MFIDYLTSIMINLVAGTALLCRLSTKDTPRKINAGTPPALAWSAWSV